MQSSRNIAYLNIDSFPIEVERVFNKPLRNRPVVLVQSENPRAHCLSVSREARQIGIRKGLTLREAYRCSRDLKTIYPNTPLYKRASSAMQRIIDRYTPLTEPSSIGRNFIDITGSERLFGSAVSAIESLRDRIRKELRFSVDAGLAVNKLVSRAAAFYSDPHGFLEIKSGREEPFIAPKRIELLPTVRNQVRETMLELNVVLIKQIHDIDIDALIRVLGPVAITMVRQAHGIDLDPVTPASQQKAIVGVEEPENDTNDKIHLLSLFRKMIIEGCCRMNSESLVSKSLTISILYSDGKVQVNSKRLREHTDCLLIWLKTIEQLFRNTLSRRTRVRRIETRFHELYKLRRQQEIFDNYTSTVNRYCNSRSIVNHETSQKMNTIRNVLSNIRLKYGDDMLSLGVVN